MTKRNIPTPTEFHKELLSKCGLVMDYEPKSYLVFEYQPRPGKAIIAEWLCSAEGRWWLKGKLREYCHQKGCESPRECPERHPDCRIGLDLDTAIAWEAGHCLAFEDLDSLRILREVVSMHSKKYGYLCQLLRLALAAYHQAKIR